MKYRPELDGLRALAAIAVIFVAVGAQLRKFPKRRQTP